jgi:membrane-associated phospholipid phosphatase
MNDAILYWNDVALEANRVDFTDVSADQKPEQGGPTRSSRALAIVHLAMYDAYAAIDTTAGESYLPQPPLPTPPSGASAQAAVAGAAHATLSALFTRQRSRFDQKLAETGLVGDPGYVFGVDVARAILKDREMDPSASDAGYVPSFAPGRHQHDPDHVSPPLAEYHAPFYGMRSRNFAAKFRHKIQDPPFAGGTDATYLAALHQVRGLGIAPELMGTLPDELPRRTNLQTVIGIFWGYDGAKNLGTPPRLYNQIVRRLAIAKGNTEAENARLFALVNAAMGDAGIMAWEQKYVHDFWRPVVGIRQHPDSDDGDVGWLPFGAPATNTAAKNFTPPFPAYPSGHATFGAAALHIARLFYGVSCGDRSADPLFNGLTFVSDEFNGSNRDNRGSIRPPQVRTFKDGLWQMILENGLSRVYIGVHWVFDAFAVDSVGKPDFTQNIGGVPLGLAIAEDIYTNGLKRSATGTYLPT